MSSKKPGNSKGLNYSLNNLTENGQISYGNTHPPKKDNIYVSLNLQVWSIAIWS